MVNDTFYYVAPGVWKDRAGNTAGGGIGPPPPPVGESKFAGHTPYRVLIGMNAPDDQANTSSTPRPQYTEAETFLTPNHKGGYVRRTFSGTNWYTDARFNALVADADSHLPYNQLPVITFKVPATRWDLVLNGTYDADLVLWRNKAKARRLANGGNGKPMLAGIHHEPDGNGPIGSPGGADRIANLELWGAMQEYCVNFMSGWATGSYVAANDVSDIMGWVTIANGHWFGSRFPKPDRYNAAYPQSLVNAMKRGRGVMMADFYDANPPNGDRLNPGGWQGNEDRASVQIQGYVTWARNHGEPMLGCGEFGCVNDYEFDNVWDVMYANRDIWAIGLHFNNFTNSRWDWRMVPDSYPSYNPVNSKGLTDLGGTPVTASYIPKYNLMVARSADPANWTAPI